MTPKDAAEYIRYKTRTNATTFTDAEILMLGQAATDLMSREILRADENILLMPFLSDLIAGTRTYKMPDNILSRVRSVEALFDGSNWVEVPFREFFDIDVPTNEADIVARYGNTEGRAFYTLYRKAILLLSGEIEAVANGLKLWCMTHIEYVDDLSSETDMSIDPSSVTHGLPRELHELWCRHIVIEYKQNREKPIALTQNEQIFRQDLLSAINTLKHEPLDRVVSAGLPSALLRGNNGFNY